MGRPIHKKFFGNLNNPPTGGEAVASFTVNNSGTNYSTSTTLTATFSAPQLAGGVAASGTVTTNAQGRIASTTLTNGGGGYTSAPTVTLPATTGTTATFTVTLTTTNQNAIAFTSYLTTGTSAVTGGDIIKQEASRRYLVRNSEGVGTVKLVTTGSLTSGTMFITATDVNGSTYFVKKLTARRVTLVRNVMNGSFEYATDASAGWSLGAAAAGVVSLSSL